MQGSEGNVQPPFGSGGSLVIASSVVLCTDELPFMMCLLIVCTVDNWAFVCLLLSVFVFELLCRTSFSFKF